MANKYKKFVATAATATLVASAIVPVASANEVKFVDVKDSSEYAPYIYDLAGQQIMTGNGENFNPGKEVTRTAAVKTLGKLLVNVHGYEVPADYKTVARFNDVAVDAKDQELVKYSALLKDLGIFTGNEAGNLNATGTLNREQMAKVVVEAYSVIEGVEIVELVADFESALTDLASVSASNVDYVKVFEKYGITTVDTFNPKGKIQRQHFAKFLSLAIGSEALATDTAELAGKVEDKVTPALEAVETAVAALPKVEEITVETAEAATTAVDAVTAAVEAATKVIAEAELSAEDKTAAEAKLAAATTAAKAVADKVAELVVVQTVTTVTAVNENVVKATISSDVKEEALTGKVLTLVNGETTLTATYVANSLTAKGEASFKLATGTKLEDAKTYTTSADWATIEKGEFVAKVAAAYVAKFEKVSTQVIAELKDGQATDNDTINVAAFNQYGEVMTDTVGTTVTGKLNGMTLTTDEITYNAGQVKVTKSLAKGDVLEFTLVKKDEKGNVVVENTFSYTVIEGEKGAVSSVKLNADKTSVPAGENIKFTTEIRDQYNNTTSSDLRWVVNGEVQSANAGEFTLTATTPGQYTVEVFSTTNTKVSDKVTVTIGAAELKEIKINTEFVDENVKVTAAPKNNETAVVGVIEVNEGSVVLPENIKFDVTTSTKDVTKEDVKVVAEKVTLKDGKTEVIVVKATSSKTATFDIKPFVGTAVDAKDVVAGSAISFVSSVNEEVASISKVDFATSELKVGQEIKKEIVIKNKHNEVLTAKDVKVAASNNAVEVKVVDGTDKEAGKTFLVVKVNDDISTTLTVTANAKNEVFEVYTLKFAEAEVKTIDAIADVTGLVANEKDAVIKPLTFKDQDGVAVEVTTGLSVKVTDEFGKAITEEDAAKAPTVNVVTTKEEKDAKGNDILVKADETNELNGLEFVAGTEAGIYNVEVTYGEGDKAIKSTFKVTVGEERAVKTLAVKASSTTALVNNSVVYTVSAVDQYGKDFALKADDVDVTKNDAYTVEKAVNAKGQVEFTVTGTESKATSFPLTFSYGTEKPVTVASSLKVLEAEDAIKSIEINKELVKGETKVSTDKLVQFGTASEFVLGVTAKDAAGEVVTINQTEDVAYTVVENNLVKADKSKVDVKVEGNKLVVTGTEEVVEGTVKVKATSSTGAVAELTIKLSNAAEKAAKESFYFSSTANGMDLDKDGKEIVLPALGTIAFVEEDSKEKTTGKTTVYLVGTSQYANVVAVDTTSPLSVKLTNSKTVEATVDATAKNGINLKAIGAGTVTLNVFQGGEIVATTTVKVTEEDVKAAKAE